MLDRMRQRTNDEGGFTLIELLVVILIIGILAAIAIPAFLSQTSKANDSAAKTQVGTLQTTMETYAAENSGSYTGATLAELQAIEPTLKDTTTATAKVGTKPKRADRRLRSRIRSQRTGDDSTSVASTTAKSHVPANTTERPRRLQKPGTSSTW